MKLKRTVAYAIGGVWGDDSNGGPDDTPVARVADFSYSSLAIADPLPTVRRVPPEHRQQRLLRYGDLLIEKSGGGEQQNVGRVVQWRGSADAICSNFINVMRPAPGYDSRYLVYLHRALYRLGVTEAATKQTTGIQNLDLGAYLSTDVSVPSQGEQQRLAARLDDEMARLTELRSAARRLGELRIEHYETSLAETLLQSQYPLVQIRLLAATGTGHTPSRSRPEYWVPDECDIPWFTLADVWQIRDDARETVTETSESLSAAGVAHSSAVLHPRGTVLLSRTASVGFSAVMGRDMAVSQDFMTWTCGPRLQPLFLLYVLRAMRPALRRLMVGSTHKTIYMPDLHALRCPLPPVSEQQAIVERVREHNRGNLVLRERLRSLDAALDEYWDALVAEAVSGRFDVLVASDSEMNERAHQAIEQATA